MKFNCGLTLFERALEQRKHWTTWYAWLPTRVAPGDCRWLEVKDA